ncbi:zinc finger domain-containing protein [Streptomyces sp. 3N207]|uniref:zinc finger domain-containing protein n=1 Tax=Streptomyces sp. 3N207 TaxID=3457417 RepID=UPI003FD6A1A7
MPRGSYGTPMTTFRVPRRKPDPRRQGTCPKCYAMQGEPCRARPGLRPRNGVHTERLKANGIDPKTLPVYQGGVAGKQRRGKKGQHTQRQPEPAKAVPRTTDRNGGLPVVRASRQAKRPD